MKFSIWYNEKVWFLDLLEEKKENISSVYFPLPKDLWNSWRPVRQYNWDYYNNSEKLVNTCSKFWIDSILLLNSTNDWIDAFSKEKLSKLFIYIWKLIDYWLTSISITNMLYVKLIKKKFPDIIIYSSVNCRLKTVEQAIFFKNLWVDILTIDRDINRNIDLIVKIKKRTWLKIQLMMNEPCLKNCPYRSTHFEAVANNNEQIFWVEFEDLTCYPMIKDNNRLFFRIPFVRPDDLEYYKDIVDIYKIVTRDASNNKIKFLLDIYNKKFYSWNLVDIFDIESSQYLAKLNIDNDKLNSLDFFNKIKYCPWDCETCSLCDIFL